MGNMAKDAVDRLELDDSMLKDVAGGAEEFGEYIPEITFESGIPDISNPASSTPVKFNGRKKTTSRGIKR